MTRYIWAGGAFTRINDAAPGDTTPDAFEGLIFDQFNVPTASVRTSNSFVPTGYDTPTTIAISGTGAEYSVNGGAFTNSAGTLNPGDAVRMRHTSSGSDSTTVTSTLTLDGSVVGTFDSTTAAAGGTGNNAPIAALIQRRRLQ